MDLLIGIAIKIIGMFLSGEAKVEFKQTGQILDSDNSNRAELINFLRMHYKDSYNNSPTVDASNFKRDN